MKPWSVRALAVREALVAARQAEGVLVLLLAGDASPARLDEARQAIHARQEVCRSALLELLADVQEELASLPEVTERWAGEYTKGSGV